MTTASLDQFRAARLWYYTWSRSAGIGAKLAMCLLFAALTGVMARVSIMLPWTPVPVTGQTFAVLLSGAVLGRWGSVSQALYIGLGAAGLPWFADAAGPFFGPTLGYLAGFVLAPHIIGRVTESYPGTRRFHRLIVLMACVNFIVIHVPGVAWLYAWMNLISGGNHTVLSAITLGSIPFIPGDIIKVLFAASMTYFILPKSR